MENPFELNKICRICLKKDLLLMSIYSPTFLVRPIEIIEKLHIFKSDDALDTITSLLCHSCLYRILDAYNLQQMAEASESRLREYYNINATSLCLNSSNPDTANPISQKLESCGFKESINATVTFYENFCDMFETKSNDVDVLNDVEIDVSSLTEAGDTFNDLNTNFVDKKTNVNEGENKQESVELQEKKLGQRNKNNVLKIPEECEICGKIFKYPGYLETHKRQHTGEKQLKCKVQRRFQCEQCSNLFTTSSNLKDHMLTHLNRRDFQCCLCDRSFKSSRELRRHEPVHKTIKDILCSICSKAFVKRSYLNAHMAAVHRGIKRHTCTQCSKMFSSKSNLVCHLRTHTGEKPYQCKRCPWKFNQSSALARHMKKHTKSNEPNTPANNQELSTVPNANISNFLHASNIAEVNTSTTTISSAQPANFNIISNLPQISQMTHMNGALNPYTLNETESTLSSSASSLQSYDFAKDNILDFSQGQQNQTQSLY